MRIRVNDSSSLETKRYVRGDLLLPGDVLLSRGGDKESDWIAWATFGPYSHAAIYHTNYCVFESVDDGVGFSKLQIDKICTKDNQRHVLLDVSKYAKFEIRRHPVVEQCCATADGRRAIEDKLTKCLIAENGLQYPALPALARAVPYFPFFMVYPFLWVVARWQRECPKVVPGMFCSQLVAAALEHLAAPPLNDFCGIKIRPEEISPNRFQSFRSRLTLVRNAIVTEDCGCSDDRSSRAFLDALRTNQAIVLKTAGKELAQQQRVAMSDFDKQYKRIKEFLEHGKSRG